MAKSSVLLGIIASVSGLAWVSTAIAQNNLNVVQVQGTLGEFKGRELKVITPTGSERVEFKPENLEIRGSGSLEVLQRGAYVIVQGEADGAGKITDAQLTLFVKGLVGGPERLVRFLPTQVEIENAFYSSQAAAANKIPVVISGTVQTVSPLVINGTRHIQTRSHIMGDVKKDGTQIYKPFPSIAKSFEIEPRVDQAGAAVVSIDLGDLKNAGANAQVTATVLVIQEGNIAAVTWPIVKVQRTEPFDSKIVLTRAPLKDVVAPKAAAAMKAVP